MRPVPRIPPFCSRLDPNPRPLRGLKDSLPFGLPCLTLMFCYLVGMHIPAILVCGLYPPESLRDIFLYCLGLQQSPFLLLVESIMSDCAFFYFLNEPVLLRLSLPRPSLEIVDAMRGSFLFEFRSPSNSSYPLPVFHWTIAVRICARHPRHCRLGDSTMV